MKAMPLPFEEFQGNCKGSSTQTHLYPFQQQQQQQQQQQLQLQQKSHFTSSSSSSASSDSPLGEVVVKGGNCYVGNIGGIGEPTSVLDTRRSPSPPTSSSTLSSSFPAVAALAASDECCPAAAVSAMDDWESVLTDSSPPHHNNNNTSSSSAPNSDHSILRLIMADVVDDPSLTLNRLLHHHHQPSDSDFGLIDSLDPPNNLHYSFFTQTSFPPQMPSPPPPTPPAKRLNTGHHHQQQQQQQHYVSSFVEQQNQNQYPYQHLNHHQQQQQQHQLQILSGHHHQQQQQQVQVVGLKGGEEQVAAMIAEQLSKAAELIETGNNPVLAQGILARLNHQLNPLGTSPLHRSAFYFKEALNSLLANGAGTGIGPQQPSTSPFALILRIGAHKAFSDVSPILQFANFTSNQAILDATEGFSTIHVVDFDMSYGAQWASLMQELALRNNNSHRNGHSHHSGVSLKITAFSSSAENTFDFDLAFTHQNLTHFAADLNLPFHLEILSLHSIANSQLPPQSPPGEAVVVNLPLSAFSGANSAQLLPLAVRFAKHLCPKIMVAMERGGDRPDAPFPLQVAHGVASYAALLDSIDAVNAGPDAAQKIERCLVQPAIERIVLGRCRGNGSLGTVSLPWRGLVTGAGFSPASFSNFAESQAECLVQRSPARGFHVEKRQSSLVLCWHRKDLVSLSAWRC